MKTELANATFMMCAQYKIQASSTSAQHTTVQCTKYSEIGAEKKHMTK